MSEIYHLKPPLINITELNITEQTKIRLKELEMQISQHDFDIEQAKQRTYSYLTPEPIKDFSERLFAAIYEFM